MTAAPLSACAIEYAICSTLNRFFFIRRPPEQRPESSPISLTHVEPGFGVKTKGTAVLRWPENLSRSSFEDFEGWIHSVLRRLKRQDVRADRDGVAAVLRVAKEHT